MLRNLLQKTMMLAHLLGNGLLIKTHYKTLTMVFFHYGCCCEVCKILFHVLAYQVETLRQGEVYFV